MLRCGEVRGGCVAIDASAVRGTWEGFASESGQDINWGGLVPREKGIFGVLNLMIPGARPPES